jgi:hypothetical protein
MTLSTIYKKAVLLPAAIAVGGIFIFSVVDTYNTKSEWLTSDAVVFYALILAFGYELIICLLSLTIFLIQFERIETNKCFKTLSWFLPPLGFIFFVLFREIRMAVIYKSASVDDFWPVIILNLPLIWGLFWGYFKYHKTKNTMVA